MPSKQQVQNRNLQDPHTKHPPRGAKKKISELAADGFSKKGIAAKLGVSADTFRAWLDTNPNLQHALDEGREKEHHELFNSLYRNAVEKGNVTAAIFLLKARHGYREGDQSDIANKVSVTFNLPAATPLDKFAGKVIDHE